MPSEMVKSVVATNAEALSAIRALHCPEGFCADISYGNGAFYKGVESPPLKFDIDPQVAGVVQASSTALPVEGGSLRAIVFDPPFLTYVRGGRDHGDGNMIMSRRFGGYWTYGELETHYVGTLREAARVLRPKGILVFKCQDIIHNHRMHCTHANVIQWAQPDFRLKDLFVLVAKHRLPRLGKSSQRHARVHHSYFLVLERQ